MWANYSPEAICSPLSFLIKQGKLQHIFFVKVTNSKVNQLLIRNFFSAFRFISVKILTLQAFRHFVLTLLLTSNNIKTSSFYVSYNIFASPMRWVTKTLHPSGLMSICRTHCHCYKTTTFEEHLATIAITQAIVQQNCGFVISLVKADERQKNMLPSRPCHPLLYLLLTLTHPMTTCSQ